MATSESVLFIGKSRLDIVVRFVSFLRSLLLYIGLIAAGLPGVSSAASLLVPLSDSDFSRFRPIGAVATAQEICSLLSHPIFRRPMAEYRLLDAVNSDLRWSGIEAAPLWMERQFEAAGISLRRLNLEPNVQQVANQNLSACLAGLGSESPERIEILKTHFLQYLDTSCFKLAYEVRKTVDSRGQLIEQRLPIESKPCLDFNYNSGFYGNWNSTTFALMLVWREAHPVLVRVLDQGQAILQARAEESGRKQAEERRLAEERRRSTEDRQVEAERLWLQYAAREKTLLEQVLNFSTVGDVNGSKSDRWVETSPCTLSNGRRQVDIRRINMTAFRVRTERMGNLISIVSSDGQTHLSTLQPVPIDRLQRAWSLAFKQCPGRTSPF
jgi:hypothetical protein